MYHLGHAVADISAITYRTTLRRCTNHASPFGRGGSEADGEGAGIATITIRTMLRGHNYTHFFIPGNKKNRGRLLFDLGFWFGSV